MKGYALIGYYGQNTMFDHSTKTITPYMSTDCITRVLGGLELPTDIHECVIHLDFHDGCASYRTLQRVRKALKMYETSLAAKQINLIVDWSARTAAALQQLGLYKDWLYDFVSIDDEIN